MNLRWLSMGNTVVVGCWGTKLVGYQILSGVIRLNNISLK